MVAPFPKGHVTYREKAPKPGYPRNQQHVIDPDSLDLGPIGSGRGEYIPNPDPEITHDVVPGAPNDYNWLGQDVGGRVLRTSMPDQIYMGRDIFAGQPERAKPYGGGAAPQPRTPTARSPGVGYPAAPYGGGVPPMPKIPRARPDATPAPGMMPMRPQLPGISPFGQPVAPMAPFHGLDRPPEVNNVPRTPDIPPQQETFRGIRSPNHMLDPPPELLRMLQLINGGFSSGGGGY